MSARLREIARQTVAIIEAGGYANAAGRHVDIASAVEEAIAGTRHYLPDMSAPMGSEPLLAGSAPASADAAATGSGPVSVVGAPAVGTEAGSAGGVGAGRPVIEVTGESTLAAARRLGPRAACLVFASARNPGGGFLTGAQAQEEAIARASALHACLSTVPDFYAFHRADRDLRYSDRVIYSPGVPVFRDDHDRLLDDAYRATFLTAAAPNLGAILTNQPELAGDVPAVLRRRARRVVEIAAAHGHRALVLGAWGCGVFRNVPATVADAFGEALAEVGGVDHVVFAILDKLRGAPVRAAFEARFPGRR